jgi:hypothetical protein
VGRDPSFSTSKGTCPPLPRPHSGVPRFIDHKPRRNPGSYDNKSTSADVGRKQPSAPWPNSRNSRRLGWYGFTCPQHSKLRDFSHSEPVLTRIFPSLPHPHCRGHFLGVTQTKKDLRSQPELRIPSQSKPASNLHRQPGNGRSSPPATGRPTLHHHDHHHAQQAQTSTKTLQMAPTVPPLSRASHTPGRSR